MRVFLLVSFYWASSSLTGGSLAHAQPGDVRDPHGRYAVHFIHNADETLSFEQVDRTGEQASIPMGDFRRYLPSQLLTKAKELHDHGDLLLGTEIVVAIIAACFTIPPLWRTFAPAAGAAADYVQIGQAFWAAIGMISGAYILSGEWVVIFGLASMIQDLDSERFWDTGNAVDQDLLNSGDREVEDIQVFMKSLRHLLSEVDKDIERARVTQN